MEDVIDRSIDKSQKGRVITIVAKIVTDEYPEWIFRAHLKNPENGISILGLSDGNLIKECRELEESINEENTTNEWDRS